MSPRWKLDLDEPGLLNWLPLLVLIILCGVAITLMATGVW